MKKIYILSLLSFLLSSSLFSQGWEWKASVSYYPYITRADHLENLYSCGYGMGTITVQKFNSSGTSIWNKILTGTEIYLMSAEVDMNNNLVVLVQFSTPITCDGITYSPVGQNAFVILKLSPSGTVLYYNMFGTSSISGARNIYISQDDKYYISGDFCGDLAFNSVVIPGDSMPRGYLIITDSDFNVLNYMATSLFMPSGNNVWIERAAVTSSGHIYVFLANASGGTELNGYQFTDSGYHLVYMDSVGNVLQAISFGDAYMGWYRYSQLQVKDETACVYEVYDPPHSVDRWLTLADPSGDTSKTESNTLNAFDVFQNTIYGVVSNKVVMVGSDLSYTTLYTDTSAGASSINSIDICSNHHAYAAGYGYSGVTGWFVGRLAYLPVGINENDLNPYSFYPNPATDHLIIENTGQDEQLRIYNSLGILIYSERLTGNTMVDVASFAPAAYIIEVSGSRKVFIKQ